MDRGIEAIVGKTKFEAPVAPGIQRAGQTGPLAPLPADAPPQRAPGTGSLSDSRNLQPAGGSSLGLAKTASVAGPSKLAQVATALGELGVVGSLAQVAKAYTKTQFDPAAIGESLGKFADNLQQVAGQVQGLPGVGEVLQGLGGVGAIVSGVNGLREGVLAAKDAGDDREKLQAGLQAAAGAAKIVGGLATTLSAFCPALAPVGAAVTTAGVAMDAGRLALQGSGPVKQALTAMQFKIACGVPRPVRQAVDDAARIISNNSAAMVGART